MNFCMNGVIRSSQPTLRLQAIFLVLALLSEVFPSRILGADFVVTNGNDSGAGSLREAILNANNLPGSHQIDLRAIRGSIALSSPLPPIYQSMTISGPGAADLTISGSNQHRVFFALQGNITIKDLSIANGHAHGGNATHGGGGGLGAAGGLFVNAGTSVRIQNVIFMNNRATGGSTPNTALPSAGGGGGLGGNGGFTQFSPFAGAGGGGGGLYGNGGNSLSSPFGFGDGQGGSGGGGLAGDGGAGLEHAAGGGGITGHGGNGYVWLPNEGQSADGGGAGSRDGNRIAGNGIAGSGGVGTSTLPDVNGNPSTGFGGGGGGGRGATNGADGTRNGQSFAGGNGGDGGFGGGGGGGGGALYDGGPFTGKAGDGGDGGVGGGGGGSGVLYEQTPQDGADGGNGGDFGGGGGSADFRGTGGSGGSGGFGGGGGGSRSGKGGDGGFGAGAGWGRAMVGTAGAYGGSADHGVDLGNNSIPIIVGGAAGAGAALGGAIFVREGGSLTLQNVSMSGGAVTGGSGVAAQNNGQAFASGIFLHGSAISIDTGLDSQQTISNDIGDGTVVSAAGALNKIGPGTLILSGNNQFRGNTTVMDGQLVVNGVLTSPTIVQSIGRLSGSGTVGNTTIEGTITPGNSIGTLHVNGSYTQSPGSHYEVELNSAGNSDRIAVNGDAILNGGTVDVVAAAGTYTLGQIYSILTSTGTVSGQYSNISDNLFLFAPQLQYTPHEVQLLLQLDLDLLSAISTTPNQEAVANHFAAIYNDTTGDLRAALDQLFLLPPDQIQSALQQLSGEAIGSLTSVSFQNSSLFLRQVTDRLRPLSGGGIPGGDQLASAWSNRRVSGSLITSLDPDTIVRAQGGGIQHFGWVNGFGTGGNVQGTVNAAGLDYDIAGSTVGVDRFVDDDTIVGFAGGYAGITQAGEAGTNANINALHAILYGSSVWDSWYGIGSLGYGNYDYRTLRQITAGGAASVARADFDGNEFSAYFESGTTWTGTRLTLQPFFGAQYVLLQRNSATETGAAPFNLSLASSSDDSSRGFLGARMIGVKSWREMLVTGQIQARWLHEFLSDARFVNARISALPTAPGFTAVGNSLGKEFGSVGATCSLLARSDLNIFVGYDLDFAQRLVAHTGYGGLQFAW